MSLHLHRFDITSYTYSVLESVLPHPDTVCVFIALEKTTDVMSVKSDDFTDGQGRGWSDGNRGGGGGGGKWQNGKEEASRRLPVVLSKHTFCL